jgi:hypothetical protein
VHRCRMGGPRAGNVPVRWYGQLYAGRTLSATGYGLAVSADDIVAERFLEKDGTVGRPWRGLYRPWFRGSWSHRPICASRPRRVRRQLCSAASTAPTCWKASNRFLNRPVSQVSTIRKAGGVVWIWANRGEVELYAFRIDGGIPAPCPTPARVHSISRLPARAGSRETISSIEFRRRGLTVAIEPRVTGIAQTGRALWLTTYNDFFAGPGPVFGWTRKDWNRLWTATVAPASSLQAGGRR